jgi:drug/metabolite transporter (DMT)-like permease
LVAAAYATVLVIWATSPLMIVWSNDSLPPLFSGAVRLTVSLILGLAILALLKQRIEFTRPAMQSYFAASLGSFGAMLLTYYGAQFVPSGLISVLFGVTPILTMVMGLYILQEPLPPPLGRAGIAVSLCGLIALFATKEGNTDVQLHGIALILSATVLFSLSAVLLKKIDAGVAPFPTTIGALIVSTPTFWVIIYFTDSFVSFHLWSVKSQLGILHLSIFGSLVGWFAYYFILAKTSITAVSLVTLIVPMFAVWIGIAFNDETLSYSQSIASVIILSGLAMFIAAKKRSKATQTVAADHALKNGPKTAANFSEPQP